MMKKRTTVYLNEDLVKILKIRSIAAEQSFSDYVNQLIYQDLKEERDDTADIKKTVKEPTVSFEKMLKELKIENAV